MKILSIETSCDDPSTRAKLGAGREEIILKFIKKY
jgi:tRNA A37 threonylcarbamoyltransferase TsaD